MTPEKIIRSSEDEKNTQIESVKSFIKNNNADYEKIIDKLEKCVLRDKNIFESIMNVANKASLGQITKKLFLLGGEYRRNM